MRTYIIEYWNGIILDSMLICADNKRDVVTKFKVLRRGKENDIIDVREYGDYDF